MKTPCLIYLLPLLGLVQILPAALIVSPDDMEPANTSLKPIAATPPNVFGDSTPLTPEAQFALAIKYFKGHGVVRNEKQAFELMELAAHGNYPEALGGLGFFYQNGIGVKKDKKTAFIWFGKGAESGSAKAQCNLGTILLAQTDAVSMREGLEWIDKAVEQGLPEALFTKGEILYAGLFGTKVDFAKAYFLLLQAAKMGHPEAKHRIATMLETGTGVAQDSFQAETWYRESARQGNAQSQSHLGQILSQSEDPAKHREALFWLMVAAEKKEATAQKLLDQISIKSSGKDIAAACIETAQYLQDQRLPKFE